MKLSEFGEKMNVAAAEECEIKICFFKKRKSQPLPSTNQGSQALYLSPSLWQPLQLHHASTLHPSHPVCVHATSILDCFFLEEWILIWIVVALLKKVDTSQALFNKTLM